MDEEPTEVVVRRRHILQSFYRAIRGTNFSYAKPVKIIFSGEDAVDEGGPRREFFR